MAQQFSTVGCISFRKILSRFQFVIPGTILSSIRPSIGGHLEIKLPKKAVTLLNSKSMGCSSTSIFASGTMGSCSECF